MKKEFNNVGAASSRPNLTKPYLKQKIKNQTPKTHENGITIIALIITIIVMLILASVTLNVGTGSIEESRKTTFVTYMQMIQTKVDYIAEYEEYKNYGQELDENNKELLQEILENETETFTTTVNSDFLKYFDGSSIASELEIENIDDEIVVDFNTREVISLNGIEYKDKNYYTQYYLEGGQTLKQQTGEIARNVSFDSVDATISGLNATFTIVNVRLTNGTLSYGRMDTSNTINWTTITNYTKSGESVTTKNITESGTYYFKLTDNITGTDSGIADAQGNKTYTSVDLRLTNSPKLEENFVLYDEMYNYSDLKDSTKWAFATDKTDNANLKYYVWIPRYAYKLNSDGTLNELQFLRGTSDVTSSGGYINSTDWTVPTEFKNKTGVWMKVTSPNQTRYRYN